MIRKKETPERKLSTYLSHPVEGNILALRLLYVVPVAGDPSLEGEKLGNYRVMPLGI